MRRTWLIALAQEAVLPTASMRREEFTHFTVGGDVTNALAFQSHADLHLQMKATDFPVCLG